MASDDRRRDSRTEFEDLQREAARLPSKQLVPPFKPAVPPQAPPKRMGVPRPIPREEPLPVAAPVHEPTEPGGFAPSPGSHGPEKRIYTPPGFASPREVAAIDAMAESRRERVVKAPESRAPKPPEELSPEVIATAKLLKKGGVALGKWVAGILAAAALSVISAIMGGKFTAEATPPLLPMQCELKCPNGLQNIDNKLPPVDLQVAIICCELVATRKLAEGAKTQAETAREVAGKASDKATLVEKHVPTVNP